MAQHALPPGAIRRTAVFGLLDADGWGWAGLKALFWFLLTIFMLGYIPNLAYYFTVGNTIDVGYNAISAVNWCPAENRDLDCPAPAGAVVPWDPSPPELALPSARQGAVAVQSGTHLYLVGGTGPDGVAIADAAETTVTLDGNFQPWTDGLALPEPRTDAAYASLSGTPYIIGGLDASGQPTTTVYMGVMEEGVLTGWALADGTDRTPDLTLPGPLSGASAVATSNGLYLMGGRTADGLVDTVWRATLGTQQPPTLGTWEQVGQLPLPAPRADMQAAAIGDYIYVAGGEGIGGVAATVFRLRLEDGAPAIREWTEDPEGWAIAPLDQQLPAPRARASTFVANGVMYVIGGVDASGELQYTTLWATQDPSDADVAWHWLDESNLTEGRADASAAVVGSFAFLIGGQGPDGAVDSTYRGNLSPAPPFFRLGFLGATLPALSIKGEIGQQLGYINAMTVGMINFAILVAIGLAFSHRARTLRLFERLSGGRFRAPREDELTPAA